MVNSIFSNATNMNVALLTEEDLRLFAQEVAEATVKAFNDKNAPESNWLNAEQVCEVLNVDRSTLWRWDKEGYLTHYKFGKRVRYKETDVQRIKAAEKGQKA